MSRLENFKTTLEAAFVAAVPGVDDGSGAAYAWIDTLNEERGNGQHRQLIWGRATTGALRSRSTRLVEYTIEATLFLHRRDRTKRAFDADVEREAAALAGAFWRRASIGWGVGVNGAQLEQGDVPDDSAGTPRRSGGVPRSVVARVPFRFRVLVREEG